MTVIWITLPTVYPKKYAHGFCFVVVIHWLIFPYPPGLLHWHCGNLTIAPVPAKQPWWIWINASCEFIMNDCITTTKQSTTKPCAYFLGHTVSGMSTPCHCLNTWLSTQVSYVHFHEFHIRKCSPLANHTKLASMSAVCTNMYKLRWISKMDKMEWFSTRNNH